jgi:hypothetical protein
MENRERRFLAGVQRKEDGSLDTSHAAWLLPEGDDREVREDEIRLSEQDLKKIRSRLSGPISGKVRRARVLAKEYGVSEEELLSEARAYTSEKIRMAEKGVLRHFHATSMDNFRNIVAEGSLLSRARLKERHPEMNISKWSSSGDVMMTRDKYDKNGRLVREGFSDHGVGAVATDVLFVFSENVMDAEGYDAINKYPTASEIAIESNCEAILVKTEEDRREALSILDGIGLDVPVLLRSEWSRG